MSKTKIFISIILSFSFLLLLLSCSKDMNSQFDNYESHNMGKNCMNCHIKGNKAKGNFTIAGTVYDSLQQSTIPDATIRLYTEPAAGGTLVITIYGDGKGNFYTTQSIEFSAGLYVSITGGNHSTKQMTSSITNGACNSCHGSSTGKIFL